MESGGLDGICPNRSFAWNEQEGDDSRSGAEEQVARSPDRKILSQDDVNRVCYQM